MYDDDQLPIRKVKLRVKSDLCIFVTIFIFNIHFFK